MYELVFWKYKEEIYLNNQEVYESIVEGEIIEGLENLETEVICNRIKNVFSTWEKTDNNSWKNPDNEGGFQIITTPQSVKIDCYGVSGSVLNQLVGILEEYHCPLYDPQEPARYDEFYEE